MNEEAISKIEEAKATGATELDLSLMGLRDLPPEIGQVTNLKWLYLSGNRLTGLPPEIGHLKENGVTVYTYPLQPPRLAS